ncbi:MAG TPA: hypothetical protein VLR27_14625 [Acidimicrobiales bacterium]|nr:hypothetical protein [Acidimicrobiales bacterium]
MRWPPAATVEAAVAAAPTGPATPPRGAEAARARLAQHDATAPEAPEPAAPAPAPAASRPSLGGVKRARQQEAASPRDVPAEAVTPTPAPEPESAPAAAPTPDADSGVPTLAELTAAWDDVLGALRGRAKALYKMGRLVEGDERTARFAVPNEPSLKNCSEKLDEVLEALAARFGRPVPLDLVVDGDAATAPRPDPSSTTAAADEDIDDEVDLDELTDAPDPGTGGIAQLKDAFPGAELLEDR